MIESKFIWMDEKFVPWKKAQVHVLSHALHYGTGVFEGIRFYKTKKGSAIFRLQDHVHRLVESWKIFGEELALSEKQLCKAIIETVKVNKLKEGYIRPLIFLGYDRMGLDPTGLPVHVMIACFEFPAYLGEKAVRQGIHCNVSSFSRIHPNSMMTKAKCTGNYINSVLAKRESKDEGYDEAILLDHQGFVSECTGENLFLVRKGKLITPQSATVLEGITRESILEIVRKEKIPTLEETVTRDELYSAEEVFVCGTAAEITPVIEIDHRSIGSGKPGKVTMHLQKTFFEIVHGENSKYKHWLTLIK
ncbi:MAG: branched-chain amino acid transaminase [Candidatus Diapherotrites archaeon]|nr:branched-chain amino acid transaminase [Candidatus Diapherotrites archaeon]